MEDLGSKVVVDECKRDGLMGSIPMGVGEAGRGARKMMSLYRVQDRRGKRAQMVLDGKRARARKCPQFIADSEITSLF